MRFAGNTTLIALVGAVVLPLGALLYLSNLPDGGRGSLLAILLQVGIVLGSGVLFAIFLARLVEQVNARRVRNWLTSTEGREWIQALPENERTGFLRRLDGEPAAADEPDNRAEKSAVDTPGASR